MAFYTKTDMVYKDYSWTVYQDDDPRITGEPDSTLLNRMEGYEVLYFINRFSKLFVKLTLSQCEKVEKMIRLVVPEDIRSQAEIREWIRAKWNDYFV